MDTKQPEPGTDKYNRQVETIKKQLTNAVDNETLQRKILLMFIMDMSYHRAAICQAEKEWLRENERIEK